MHPLGSCYNGSGLLQSGSQHMTLFKLKKKKKIQFIKGLNVVSQQCPLTVVTTLAGWSVCSAFVVGLEPIVL